MKIVKSKVYLVASDIVTCPAVTAGEEGYPTLQQCMLVFCL